MTTDIYIPRHRRPIPWDDIEAAMTPQPTLDPTPLTTRLAAASQRAQVEGAAS